MKNYFRMAALLSAFLCFAGSVSAQTRTPDEPTWWSKYQFLLETGASAGGGPTTSLAAGANVDVSNECGPQSETFITLNPAHPKVLAAGSNEIYRLPMRGYFSSDGGVSWGGVDLPLPPPLQGTNGTRFGSDPSLAFDTRGNVFYGYIVVFFGNGDGVKGTEMAVARSSDGGRTYPRVSFFSFESGSNHFNDKPMIAADTNPASPFRDNVYIAWDTTGGSTDGGIRLARSTDHGATFSIGRVDYPSGPTKSIGAVPFIGPNGETYIAWNDYFHNTIAFSRSFDGGATFSLPGIVALKTIPFDMAIPAESYRGALVYPACDADRSAGPHRGRLYCSWMDLTLGDVTDIFISSSDDRGATWSALHPVTDQLEEPLDRFNHWLSVDPTTGNVNVSFYDTRNDTTGFRFMTDVYFTRSTDGGASFLSPNLRVTNANSNEHDCNGLFPCPSIDYNNQQGDYEGLASFGGVSHPIWTDSRRNRAGTGACGLLGLMEEVFTATIQ